MELVENIAADDGPKHSADHEEKADGTGVFLRVVTVVVDHHLTEQR